MRRHPEDPGDLIDLELSRIQKLCLLRVDGDWRILHPFFENGYLPGILAATEGRLPAVPDLLRILQDARMLEDTGWCGTILKELTTVFLTGHRESDAVFRHRDRAVSDKAVKTKSRDLHHLVRSELYDRLFHSRRIGSLGPEILVVDVSVLIPVHRHAVWHQRIQCCDFTLAVPDHLDVCVPPQ